MGCTTGIESRSSVDQLQGGFADLHHEKEAFTSVNRHVGTLSARSDLNGFAEICLSVEIFTVARQECEPKRIGSQEFPRGADTESRRRTGASIALLAEFIADAVQAIQ
jgi:hypothetical protein